MKLPAKPAIQRRWNQFKGDGLPVLVFRLGDVVVEPDRWRRRGTRRDPRVQ
ncbi:hypothetical protein AB0F91_39970 [Amycolatopsis sp. NPDC023774]|uniref:hypothetical protein n=1 Tax=Amycolatopsis sp. NPDC023774 TaxID=3155015 RepID=UPI0033D73167